MRLPLAGRRDITRMMSCTLFISVILGFLHNLNTQLRQRCQVGETRRFGHQTRGGGRFREGDNITNIVGAGQQHGQTVQTKRQARVRRRTVFQRIQQEAELLALLLFIDTENTKYGLLHFTVVNTHRPPPTS